MIKTIVLSLMMVFITSIPSEAQNLPSMRSLATEQLFQYGQAIYQRGDYSQAETVFAKLLAMDPHHQGAYEYALKLNQKGAHIPLAVPVKEKETLQVQVKQENQQRVTQSLPVVKVDSTPQQIIAKQKPQETLSAESTDLTQDIQYANEAIEKLKTQVAQLREQLKQGQ